MSGSSTSSYVHETTSSESYSSNGDEYSPLYEEKEFGTINGKNMKKKKNTTKRFPGHNTITQWIFLLTCILMLLLLLLVALSVIVFLPSHIHYDPQHLNQHPMSDIFDTDSFGELKYECFGICYCDEEKDEDEFESRRVARLDERTVRRFVVAITSVLALAYMKDKIGGICDDEMRSSCAVGAIRSEVGECEESSSMEESNAENRLEKCHEWMGELEKNVFQPNGVIARHKAFVMKKGFGSPESKILNLFVQANSE